jgi:hypothetical protein
MTYAAIRQVITMKAKTPTCQAHTHPNSKAYPQTTKLVIPMTLRARDLITGSHHLDLVLDAGIGASDRADEALHKIIDL